MILPLYLPAVSSLNTKLGNQEDADYDKSIVKGLFFYIVFLWCILFEVYVSFLYFDELDRSSSASDYSKNLNKKYQMLLLIPTAILNILEYFFVEP